jgi:serine/alanine adding enzyme
VSVNVSITEDPDNSVRELWAGFVAEHAEAGVYQSPEAFDVYRASRGFRPALAVADDGGHLLGVALGVIQRDVQGWYGFPFSRLLVRDGPLCGSDENAAVLVLRLEEWARRRSGNSVISCRRAIAGLNAHTQEPHLNFLIDLSGGSNQVWEQLHPSRRKQVRRSERRGLVVRQESEPDLLAHYEVLGATYGRAGLPLFHRSYFESAWAVMGARHMMRVFGAYCAGRLVGTRMVLSYRSTIYDWFAGSLPEFHDRYVNDALVWAVLEWGCQAGFATFDFGGAGHPDRPYGVRDFKRKFGGEMVTSAIYRRALWPGAGAALRLGRAVHTTLHRRGPGRSSTS